MAKHSQFTNRIDYYNHIISAGGKHAPISQLIGLELVNVGEGTATFELEVTPNLFNSLGILHGGIIATIADAAMGVAFGTLCGINDIFNTVEFKINFLHPVKEGRIRARGRVVHRGNKTGVVEGEVENMKGDLVAKSLGTMILLPPKIE
jgi:uncharacterized protein (TIGR00369 family)